jgi:hypothetical protein
MKHHKQIGMPRSKPLFFSTAAVFLFAFICFFPNPALPIGNNTGLQAGQIISLLSLPVVLILGMPRKQMLALLLLVLPILLSGFLVVVTGRALSDETAIRTTIATLLIYLVLVPVGRIVNKRYMAPLLCGVAWAIALHAIVAVNQAYWFAQDVFPLSGLYQNPSFRSAISQDPETWALYVKRPFGLFPEPSAMAASLGPWLVLMAGLLLYPKLRYRMTRGTRALLVSAAILGVLLILIAQSGYTVWLLASLLLMALPALKYHLLRLYRPGSLLTLVAFILVGAALEVLVSVYITPRADLETNSSWLARMSSISWSLDFLMTTPSTLLFGVGPGQSSLILTSPGATSLPPASSGAETVIAVWSVMVNYIVEAGLFGALALALILILVLQAIVRSSARLIGVSCLVAWLAGVVFTTSYSALLPIWLFLGVLLVWDRIFPVRATVNGPGRNAGALLVPKVVKT